jgi:hypothetical protein
MRGIIVMPSRSTLIASSVYILSVFSLSHGTMAETNDIDAQIRDAAVAQLNQNKAQALEKALNEAEKETVDDTPSAQQQHLQKILKLAIAKATNEHNYNLENNAQKLIEQIPEENNEAPAKATATTTHQTAMNDKLEDETVNALSFAQASMGDKEKEQAAEATTSTPSPSTETSQISTATAKPTEAVASTKAQATTNDEASSKPVATEEKTQATQVSQSKPTSTEDKEAPKAEAETEKVAQASVKTKPSEPAQPQNEEKPSKLTPTPVASSKPEEKTVARTAPETTTQAAPKPAQRQAIQLKTEQWMYIGQFKDGAWTEKTIAIGDTLPQTGQQYAVSQSVNVRAGLPNKENMPEVITSLGNNAKVTLVELKASGKQGYYWGKIER